MILISGRLKNVLVIHMTCEKYNAFQFKILRFRLVSVPAESYGQILSLGFGIGPKPKRWFRSYTTVHSKVDFCTKPQIQ